MTRPQVQAVIPGCESDDEKIQTPELTARVHAWLDAQEAQRRAALETRTVHALMVAELVLANVKRYPYLDRSTGKKHYVVVARDPKAKTIKAPKPKTAKQEAKADKAAEKKQRDKAESVEHRKVSRASVEGELRHAVPAVPDDVDPFERTRRAMDGLAT
jgi:hypothetical protein